MYPELVTLSSLQCQWKESYFYGGAPLILIQTSKTGQKNRFVKTTIIFYYAGREPRETCMGPHGCMGREFRNGNPGVTRTSLEKQSGCVRLSCKVTIYRFVDSTLRSQLALTLIPGRVWSRGGIALPREKDGNQVFQLCSPLKTLDCHALQRDSLSEFSTGSVILSFL